MTQIESNICICYPNKNAFSETFIRDQIDYLKPVLQLYEGWLPNQIAPHGNIFPFPLNKLAIRGTLRNIFPALYNILYDYFLTKTFKKYGIKYVLGNYGPIGSRIAEISKKNKINFVVHFHGFDAHDTETIKKFKNQYRKIFHYAHAIVAVSVDMKQQLISLGADDNKIFVVPCGVDTNFFTGAQPSLSDPIFLFVGRFVHKKSPLELIHAFHLTHLKYPESRLVMIGQGPLLDQCKEEVSKLNLTSAVDFAGVKTRSEIKAYMLKARAYVQHSVMGPNGDCEGTPVSLLEAASCGLPVISTRHTGIKQAVIHDKTGYLVEEHDIKGMSSYMNKVIEDRASADQLGQEGQKHILLHYETVSQKEKLLHLLKNHKL